MDQKRLPIILLLFLIIPFSGLEASIIQKVFVVNPSKESARTIPVKVYLPKEIGPQNIINKENFEIVYDAKLGQYVAVQDVTLGPGDSVTKIIEFEDIWKVKKADVVDLKSSLNKTVDKLKETSVYKDAKDIKVGIDKQIKELEDTQAKVFHNPEEQMAAYREAEQKFTESRKELDKISNLVIQQSAQDVVSIGHISVKTTWRIIIGIIILLSVLSLFFFAIWQNQLSRMPKEDSGNNIDTTIEKFQFSDLGEFLKKKEDNKKKDKDLVYKI